MGIGVQNGHRSAERGYRHHAIDCEWQMRNYHQKWYAGETISVGIGQGAVAVTPIQLARAIAGITSGGQFEAASCGVPSRVAGAV